MSIKKPLRGAVSDHPTQNKRGLTTCHRTNRGLRITSGLPTIRPQCAGQEHHSSALRKKTHTAFIYIASHDGQQTPKRKTFIGRFPFAAYLVLPYDDCPEGRALGGCSKLILIPTLPKLDGSLVLPVTLFAPSTAGIVLTGFVTGRNGLRAFFTASIRPLKVVVNTSDP